MLSNHQMLEPYKQQEYNSDNYICEWLDSASWNHIASILEHKDTFYSSILAELQVLRETDDCSNICGST